MKVKLLRIILLFSFKAMAQVPTAGLVASYPFTGNANDASPYANHGTVHGATLTADRFGNANCAYSFDGSDYISVAGAVGINNANYSYSVWVKAAVLPAFNEGMEVFEFGTYVNNIYGQLLSLNNGYVGYDGFTVSSGSTDGTHTVFSDDFNATIDTWYNLILTRSNTTVSLYVNGQLTKTADVTGLTTYYNSPLDMYIGTRAQGFHYWNGIIDDIGVYNRVLTPEEIAGIVTSIETRDAVELGVYPNPSKDVFNVVCDKPMSEATLTVFNSMGQVVQSQTNVSGSSLDVNIANQKCGIYLLQVINEGKIMRAELVKD